MIETDSASSPVFPLAPAVNKAANSNRLAESIAQPSPESNFGDLARLVESAAIGIVQLHPDTKTFARANRIVAEMVGRSTDELAQLSFADLASPADAAQLDEIFESLLHHDRGTFALEVPLRRNDGETIWAALTIGTVCPEEDSPERIAILVRDVTGQKRQDANAAFLTTVRRKLASLADVSAIEQLLLEKTRRHLGVARVECARLPDGVDPLREAFIADLDAGRPVAIANVATDARTTAHAQEYSRRGCAALLHAPMAGEARCHFVLTAVHDRPRPWREDEINLMRELAETAGLVLERARTVQALREIKGRVRRAMEIETVGIAITALEGAVVEANTTFLQLSGYSREEMRLGLVRWDWMTPPEWMEPTRRALAGLAAHGRSAPYEKKFRRKSGETWWALVVAARLAPNEAVEFIIDITRSKAIEEELRRYREELEEIVIERTAALDSANGALRDEILERKRNESERHTLVSQLVSAQEAERQRISRELHDGVGQHLTALMLGLRSLHQAGWPDGTPPEVLKDLQRLGEKIGKEIHDLALALRPTALDDLGLARTLANFVDEWSARANVEVDFHISGWENDRLPSSLETTIYRVVCEAFTNILKHAGARRVSLIVERRPDQVVAIVEDDGRGFDVECARLSGHRLGLTGMRERAMLVGGELNIESVPGQGTTLFLRIPLPSRRGKSP